MSPKAKIRRLSQGEVYHALNDGEIVRDGHQYTVTFSRYGGNTSVTYYYNFNDHPLRELLAGYLLKDTEELAGGTINHRCRTLKLLGDFMRAKKVSDINPEVFSAFILWMFNLKKPDGDRRFKESSLPSYVYEAKAFYKSGICQGHPGWSQRDLDIITSITDKHLRGCRQRARQDSIDKTLSLDTFTALVRAVSLEFEQCQQVFQAREIGERCQIYNHDERFIGRIDPNPFVVWSLLAALKHGLRSSELNTLTTRDLRIDEANGNHELYVHAPDKSDSFIPVDETFLRAWRFCEAWSQEAREMLGPPSNELFKDALFVYPATNSHHLYPLMEFDTYRLNESHLPYFLKKWFAYQITDEEGNRRPLLHSERDPTHRLDINYRKIRNAFAARFAEREKNRTVTSQVLRHRSLHTTEKYYLHQARLDHAKKVQIALKAEAYLLAVGLKNRLLVGVTKDTIERARQAGAMTREGICGSALNGNGCTRASNCLECPHLVVLVSRKPRMEADRNAYIKQAEKLEAAGDLRGAENARSRAKICQAHLIRMEHTFRDQK